MEEKQKRLFPGQPLSPEEEVRWDHLVELLDKSHKLEKSMTEEQRMARNCLIAMTLGELSLEAMVEMWQPYTTWSEETREETEPWGRHVKVADEKAGYFKRIPLE